MERKVGKVMEEVRGEGSPWEGGSGSTVRTFRESVCVETSAVSGFSFMTVHGGVRGAEKMDKTDSWSGG